MAGSYTYPVQHPEGTLTPEQIHAILGRPTLVAKRLADLTAQKFIADWLLSGRYNAVGGGIFYETGEEIFAADAPKQVAPGSEYPKTVLSSGEIAAAKTVKWGLETDITDEKIARERVAILNRGLGRLGNTVVRHVDSVAMAVVASKITDTSAASAQWTTAGAMVESLLTAQAERDGLGLGLELNTVVLTPIQFAKIVGMLISDKALPQEDQNMAITGRVPIDAYGFTWATTPNYLGTDPLLVDRENLGGMADEKLGSPGYVDAGQFGVEAASVRAKSDKWEVRARRVTVPVVTEPKAGIKITGTGL